MSVQVEVPDPVAPQEGQAKAGGGIARDVGSRSRREASPEFERWFAGSKVVDDQGRPLVVYHGSAHPSWSEGRGEFGSTNGMGEGAYFTADPKVADDYAAMDSEVEDDPPFLIAVYLSLKNPYVSRDHMVFQSITPEKKHELLKQGFDGVIGVYPNGGREFVAFRPEQIKSAIGNAGTFDGNNPDIRHRLQAPSERAGKERQR